MMLSDWKILLITRLAAGALTVAASSASAANFPIFVNTGTNKPFNADSYATFDSATLGGTAQTTSTGVTVAFTGAGGFRQGSVPFLYSAPITSNGNGAWFGQADRVDVSTYVSTGIGTATLTFAGPLYYFGLLWGSIDSYNTITFFSTDGLSRSFTGSDIGFLGESRYVNFTTSEAINRVVLSSADSSFEFDNVAIAAIPEPATWGMMVLGFGAMGYAMRYRQKVATRVSYAA